MNERFMDPCANFFGAECHSVERLSTAHVKRTLQSDKTWEVSYTKVDPSPFSGNDGQNVAIVLKPTNFRIPALEEEWKQSLFGVPTKVDLHVCYVTTFGDRACSFPKVNSHRAEQLSEDPESTALRRILVAFHLESQGHVSTGRCSTLVIGLIQNSRFPI